MQQSELNVDRVFMAKITLQDITSSVNSPTPIGLIITSKISGVRAAPPFNYFSLMCVRFLLPMVLSLWMSLACSQAPQQGNVPNFAVPNPLSQQWLQDHLQKASPRLLLQDRHLSQIRQLRERDTLVGRYYDYLQQQGDALLTQPVLQREMIGKRMLNVSRNALRRLPLLSLLYRIEGDTRYLDRMEAELLAVCQFADWNPNHFLDVAEMALAVSLALDWSGAALPEASQKIAREALLNLALLPSQDSRYNQWLNRDNNWNQVCNAGMAAAALTLAEEQPELAATIIHRAVKSAPRALAVYGPDGVYPEGPGYWTYGTAYSVFMFDMFNTALQTDFGLSQTPGLRESGTYMLMMTTPGNRSYNYADSNKGGMELSPQEILLWFAREWQEGNYFHRNNIWAQLPKKINPQTGYSRYSTMGLIWLSDLLTQTEVLTTAPAPTFWSGQGPNPIAVIQSAPDYPGGFYLGLKGGSGSVNHGNMDAGSFVFEWREVMWSIDPGNQSYTQLEEVLGDQLWDRDQESPRWTLLTKNNFGHSTLTVNDALHQVEGFAALTVSQAASPTPAVQLDLSPVFVGQLKQVQRTFQQVNDSSFLIRDQWECLPNTRSITWAMMTQAEVSLTPEGAILHQNGQRLALHIEQPGGAFTVREMDPPPLRYDKQIPGLKRIEFKIDFSQNPASKGEIVVSFLGLEPK